MADFSDLIARLEKAKGPSRDLDARIEHTLAGTPAHWEDDLPAYTSSLDAAVSLVPESVGFKIALMPCAEGPEHWASVDWGTQFPGATPAIALCIAALKARMRGGDR